MSAIFSPCGQYRYSLTRELKGDGPVYAFFGVNPSTAGALVPDPTVTRWTGFCNQWGARRFVVGNVFSFQSTDVRRLASVQDPFGPEHWRHLEGIVAQADVLVPCWGNTGKVPKRMRHHFDVLAGWLRMQGKPIYCFGRTDRGDPKHPLYLPNSTQLERY